MPIGSEYGPFLENSNDPRRHLYTADELKIIGEALKAYAITMEFKIIAEGQKSRKAVREYGRLMDLMKRLNIPADRFEE